MFEILFRIMLTLLIFLIILGLLVLSHEFGHFIAARKSGMKVYEFGFGFPPRVFGIQVLKRMELKKIAETETITVEQRHAVFSQGEITEEIITDKVREIDVAVPVRKWRIIWGSKQATELPPIAGYDNGTIYSLNWFPLGGFVKIKGEEGENEDADSFVSKSFTKKAITLVAGVAMNILLAVVIFSIGFMVGLPQTVDGLGDSVAIKDKKLQIMQILPDMPATQVGLRVGDEIAKIGEIQHPTVEQMQNYADSNKGKEIILEIKRGQEILVKKITPIEYKDTKKGGIGVALAEVGMVKYPWYKAIYKGIVTTVLYLEAIMVGFYMLIKGLISGTGAGAAVSGPIGIAVMTGQIAKLGISYLLNFTAVLSLNLAIINILPIPALDGGRLLFIIIGKIFKRRVSLKFEQIAHTAGFVLLMLLVIVVTVKDLGQFSGAFKGLIEKVF